MKSGIIVVDKPQNLTSHDVVAKVRKQLKTKKVGHTGTLDPLATGVLVVCVNQATKLVNYLTCDDKTYEAEMQFGIQTDTGDITGKVIATSQTNITLPQIEEALSGMVGKQKQVPPMYSAIKVNGKKLYEYARSGIEIEREAREINIFSFDNISYDHISQKLKFKVACSKGTYIRTLCEDIAKKLGTIGTMTSLRRVQAGRFNIQDSVLIDDISEEKIISIEKLFDKKIDVTPFFKRLINGEKIEVKLEDGLYKLYNGEFIGIGKVQANFLKREIILEKNDD